MINLDTVADFIWFWSDKFFLETSEGNFIWSDPDYQGNNTIVPFKGTMAEYCKQTKIPFGRDKGKHTIRGYCGEDVVIKG